MTVFCSTLVGTEARAGFVDPSKAEKAAKVQLDMVSEKNRDRSGFIEPSIIDIRKLCSGSGLILAYVAKLSPKGFIIVSADTDIEPIIAYSLSSDFIFENNPDNLLYHMVITDLSRRISALPENARNENREKWEDFLAGPSSPHFRRAYLEAQQWGPYITTKWYQGEPYNKFCPIDPETEERSLTGCVATAMAQIANFWKYPKSLEFTQEDAYETRTREINIDADAEEYDFPGFATLNGMLSGINYDNEDDIAALNFACGIIAQSDYASALTTSEAKATFFTEKMGYGFADEIQGTHEYFFNILTEDMKRGLPAMLLVSSEEPSIMGSGHAIIVDGYQETGEYHIVFGVGGYFDGWYFLPDEIPYSLNIIEFGIMKIYPYPTTRELYYVDGDITASGDGLTWATAFKTISEVPIWAARGQVEIWVKAATYDIEEPISFHPLEIALYGGFAGNETHRKQRNWQKNETIIDGGNRGKLIFNRNHLLIDGFTLTGGNGGYTSNQGGGIYNYTNAFCTISNCVMKKNNAYAAGGAIFNASGSYCTVSNSRFDQNNAYDYGGAIFSAVGGVLTVRNCTFSRNSSTRGAAIYLASGTTAENYSIVSNSTFADNSANAGAGIFYSQITPAAPIIENCRFVGNSVSTKGGGIYLLTKYLPKIDGCIFSDNNADWGGGIYISSGGSSGNQGIIGNSIFYSNHAESRGGAICADSVSDGLIAHCTFYRNAAGIWGGAIDNYNTTLAIYNSIFRDDDAAFYPEISDNYAMVTAAYSNIQGGYPGQGENIIDADPLFVDPGNGDFRLTASSPCIDAGTNDFDDIPYRDINGLVRIQDGNGDMTAVADIGAHEYAECGIGDVDKNGVIDLADAITVLSLLTGELPDSICLGSDIDGDYTLGTPEVAFILQYIAMLYPDLRY